jgi:hypothetical protein
VSPQLSLTGGIGSFTTPGEFGKIVTIQVGADLPKDFEGEILYIRAQRLYIE